MFFAEFRFKKTRFSAVPNNKWLNKKILFKCNARSLHTYHTYIMTVPFRRNGSKIAKLRFLVFPLQLSVRRVSVLHYWCVPLAENRRVRKLTHRTNTVFGRFLHFIGAMFPAIVFTLQWIYFIFYIPRFRLLCIHFIQNFAEINGKELVYGGILNKIKINKFRGFMIVRVIILNLTI